MWAVKRRHLEQLRDFEQQKHERLAALGVQYAPKVIPSPESSEGSPKPGEVARQEREGQLSPDTIADSPSAEVATETARTAEAVGAVEADETAEKTSAMSPTAIAEDDVQERQDGDPERDAGNSARHDEKGQHPVHDAPKPAGVPGHHHGHDERDRDIMVETEEDTVIY